MTSGAIARELYAALEGGGHRHPLSRRLVGVLIAVILLACLVAILETEPVIAGHPVASWALGWLNLLFVGVFLLEFLTRFVVVGVDPRFRGFRGRLRYLFRPLTVIDLAALIPCILVIGLSDSYLLRLARLLRLLVVFRLVRFTRAWSVLLGALMERRFELILSVALAAGLLLSSATLLHVLERTTQPQAFGSIPRALWWAVTTMTTVGYGDVVPVTPLGRMVAAVAALMAVGMIAIPTGILAAAFSEGLQRQRRETELHRRELDRERRLAKVERDAGPPNRPPS